VDPANDQEGKRFTFHLSGKGRNVGSGKEQVLERRKADVQKGGWPRRGSLKGRFQRTREENTMEGEPSL